MCAHERSVIPNIQDQFRVIVELIRGILDDRREARAVRIAKLALRGEILVAKIFLDENDEKHRLLNFLRVEVETVTKKIEIEKLLIKLSKILEIEYPD